MFCPNCGTKSHDNAKFCYNCGFNLTPISDENSQIATRQSSSMGEKANNVFSIIKNKVSNALSSNDYSYNVEQYIDDNVIQQKVIFYILLPNFVNSNSYLNDLFQNHDNNISDEEKLESFKEAVNHILDLNIYEWKGDLEYDIFKSMCDSIIDDINSQTQQIINNHGLGNIFSNLIIEESSKFNFSNQIYQIFLQKVSNTYSSLLTGIQSLQSKKHIWNDINDSKVGDNVLSAVLNFAGGALAVANPLIGIPMLVGNFFRDKQKDKNTSQSAEIIFDEYDKLMNVYDDMAQKRINGIKEIQNIIGNKVSEAIIQRNEILKQYKNSDEISVIYNELIYNDSENIKQFISENENLEFLVDIMVEEGISNNFKRLLTK